MASTPPHREIGPLEFRSEPRVAIEFEVDVYSAGFNGPLGGRSRDLSVCGACVATESVFSYSSIQRVVLHLPTGKLELPAQGRWQAEVAGEDKVLTGIVFDEPDERAYGLLWDLVLERSKQVARFFHARSDFSQLGMEGAVGLSQITRERRVPAGHTLYRQDTLENPRDSIFLVQSGEVTLQVRVGDAFEITAGRLGPGRVFGGFPLIAGVPHAESALATRDSVLFEIDGGSYRYLRAAKPWLAQQLADVVTRSHARRVYDLLARNRDRL